jgi:hypothetical protein
MGDELSLQEDIERVMHRVENEEGYTPFPDFTLIEGHKVAEIVRHDPDIHINPVWSQEMAEFIDFLEDTIGLQQEVIKQQRERLEGESEG